ncbi:MAG: hypothetical protein QM647_16845 [Asticcacaulis sp.]|uniref:glycine-rich domain-containing protein n=1 Tax=Asticcacaulis sp. TaxID=1872648 RepID=UPI0039E398C5
MVTDTALWQAINAYELDNADAAFPFGRRLARDNGWSHGRALSAIAEYKRFIYLIMTQAGTVLTPSEDVDEVWHLHLIYTQDYWHRFCGQTLGRSIHHGPTQGGLAEDSRYMDCYRRTLEIYEREFGPPPPDVWPDPVSRFKPNAMRRIDLSETFLLPKRQVFLCLTAAAPLALAGCGLTTGLVTEAVKIRSLIWGGFALIGLVCLLVNLAKIRKRGLIGFLIVGSFFTLMSALWLGMILNDILRDLIHSPVNEAIGQGAAGLVGYLFAMTLCLAEKRGKGGGSGCGSGCSSWSGCSSDSGGHSGGSGSGCGGSGCGGGCGGGGD